MRHDWGPRKTDSQIEVSGLKSLEILQYRNKVFHSFLYKISVILPVLRSRLRQLEFF